MAMVTFELDENAKLTEEEKKMLAAAKDRPIVYDEDCPELTEEMERAFIAARKANPLPRHRLTLYVSSATMEKAKAMGSDYIAVLSKLLDQAVDEYRAIS